MNQRGMDPPKCQPTDPRRARLVSECINKDFVLNCGSTGFFGGQRGQQALWADAKEQSHVPLPGDYVSTASSNERKRKGKR